MLLAEFHHKAAQYSWGAWFLFGFVLILSIAFFLGLFFLGRRGLRSFIKSNTRGGS